MVLLLDFSDLLFKDINFEEDKVTYELTFTSNDTAKIVREKFNNFDFNDLKNGEVDDLIVKIKTLPNTEQSEILQYLKENVSEVNFKAILDKLQ